MKPKSPKDRKASGKKPVEVTPEVPAEPPRNPETPAIDVKTPEVTSVLKLQERREAADEAYVAGLSNEELDVDVDQLLDQDDQEQLESNGVLDVLTVSRHLSLLQKTADGSKIAYVKLSLVNLNLYNVGELSNFTHVQQLNISYNQLTDLIAVSSMKHLTELNASNNQIDRMLEFEGGKTLRFVDLSYNCITETTVLTDFPMLDTLLLDHNDLRSIGPLGDCPRLTHLSFSHNKVSQIENLESASLKHLDIACNEITRIEGLDHMKRLQTLILDRNKIRSLKGVATFSYLDTLDLEGNEIIDLTELNYVKQSFLLRDLNLSRNPVEELPDFRQFVLLELPHLTCLNRRRVEATEVVGAVNLLTPSREVKAHTDHMTQVMYQFFQPSQLYSSTLPDPTVPYPILVLVAPEGCGREDLAKQLVVEFSTVFMYGPAYTTRELYEDETAALDYYHLSNDEFESEIKSGVFLQTYDVGGHLYGLDRQVVDIAAENGLACVTHMELEGMLSLRQTNFRPRYVLLLPSDRDQHKTRLEKRGCYKKGDIEEALRRADVCREFQAKSAGMFDAVVKVDDMRSAYSELRDLVAHYLGVETARRATPKLRDATPETGPSAAARKVRVASANRQQLSIREALMSSGQCGFYDTSNSNNNFYSNQFRAPSAPGLMSNTQSAPAQIETIEMTSGESNSSMSSDQTSEEAVESRPVSILRSRPNSSRFKVLPPISAEN